MTLTQYKTYPVTAPVKSEHLHCVFVFTGRDESKYVNENESESEQKTGKSRRENNE